MKKWCENCIKKDTCTRETGLIFGFCNVDFKPIKTNETERVTMGFRVYGVEGHRQRESFCSSYSNDFSIESDVRIIEVLNSDKTGTNAYSEVWITRNNRNECLEEISGQITDGIFENSKTGRIEYFNDSAQKWEEIDIC